MGDKKILDYQVKSMLMGEEGRKLGIASIVEEKSGAHLQGREGNKERCRDTR